MGMVTDHTNEPLTPMVFIGGRPHESARATQELIESYNESERVLLGAGFMPASVRQRLEGLTDD